MAHWFAGSPPKAARSTLRKQAEASRPNPKRRMERQGNGGAFSGKPRCKCRLRQRTASCLTLLVHVAFAAAPETRSERASKDHTALHQQFNDKQQAFVDFVLTQHIQQGVGELAGSAAYEATPTAYPAACAGRRHVRAKLQAAGPAFFGVADRPYPGESCGPARLRCGQKSPSTGRCRGRHGRPL